ncbi:Pepco domain-containing protein [Bradyrhizobium genosp. A]|uniref:Pepco domain-containing protein n=1 Tax=Bradyrhizobium genosp. A TaxID=83626 RepID=UPI003CE9B97B
MTSVLVITHGTTPAGRPKSSGETVMGKRDDSLMGDSIRDIPVDKLRSSLQEVIAALEGSLKMPDTIGSFDVDSLDIELELSAEGQIGLLGNGAKVGGKGSLTLRLKRPPKGGVTKPTTS